MRATIGAGVPAGASKPNQAVMSKPANPLSAIVGSSGAVGQRWGDVTASAFTLPAFALAEALAMLSNMNCSRPPSRSTCAAAVPL